MLRFIHMTKGDDLSHERIHIGDDFDTDAADFAPPGYTIISDTKQDIEPPDSFPINCEFQKVG